MKRLFAALLLALTAAACKGKPDNAAVRYAESLKEDTVRARAAADKANAAIQDEADRLKEAESLPQ